MSASHSPRGLIAALRLVLAFALITPGVAMAQAPSVADIEDEVMCVQCGRPLATSSGSAADQERALIQGWIDDGRSKAQIKDLLVGEYGERALVNDKSPIAASAPWLAALAGIASITLLLRRRRQRDTTADATLSAEPAASAPQQARVSAADDARIDAELAELD